MACRSVRPDQLLAVAAVVIAAGLGARAAWAQAASVTATLDKKTVDVGQPVTLTVVASGDLTTLKGLPTVTLPEPFQVVAQSQSSNFSIRGRLVEQTVSFYYVLVSREPGTFTLGPFSLQQKAGEPLTTGSLELTVRKPVVPPGSEPAEQFLL